MLRNFFKEHKFAVSLLIVFVIILLGINFYSHKSLIYNFPHTFFELLIQRQGESPYFSLDTFYKIKIFSDFLLVLPYNLLYPFIPNTPLAQIDLFAFSAHFSILCALFINYFVARKTKRYDIAACAFAFYCLFYLPNFVSYTQEVHISTMLYFILLQYFLTKENLSSYDYLIAGITAILCMATHEIQIFFGIILVIFTFLYAKRNPPNLKLKYAIGFSGLIMIIVSVIIFLLFPDSTLHTLYIRDIGQIKSHLFQYSLIFTTFGIFFIIINAFLKRNYRFSEWKKIIFVLLIAILYLWQKTEFIPNIPREMFFYAYSLCLLFPVIILLLLSDLFDYTEKHQCLFSNIVLISSIIGLLQIVWQINNCRIFLDYINIHKDKINNSQEAILYWDKANIQEKHNQDFCIGSEIRSLFLSDKTKIHTISVLPDKKQDKNACRATEMFFTPDGYNIYLNDTYIPIKNDYWDFSDILPFIDEYEKMLESKNKLENNTGK